MEKKISFSGIDNGASSMMKKLREEARITAESMISQARDYSKESKAQLSFVDEQVRSLEKRNRLNKEYLEMQARDKYSGKDLQDRLSKIGQDFAKDNLDTKILRDILEAIKLTSKEEISENRKDVESRISSFKKDPSQFTPEEQLKLAYQKELLTPDKKDSSSTAMNVFKGIMGAEFAKGVVGTIREIPQVKNEIDAVLPAMKLRGMSSGALVGGTIGLAAGAFQTGTSGTATFRAALEGAGIGAKTGNDIAEIYGAYVVRHLQEKAKIETSALRGRAISGNNVFSMSDYSNFGFSYSESSDLSNQLAQSRGRRLQSDTLNAILMQQGAGVDIGVTSQLIGTGRFSNNPLAGASTLLANRFNEDRSGFSDAVVSLTQLVREFSNSSENVNSNMAAQTMLMFNNVGGGFDINDPRSMQRISQVNQSLANPKNPLSQAENIAILRKLNPTGGIFDIMEAQSKGLQTPGFLSGKLENLKRFGGDDQFAMLSLQRDTGLSYSATRELYENRDKLSMMSPEESEKYIAKILKTQAERNTGSLEKSTADISNAFATSMIKGVDTVEKYFEKSMKTVADKTVQYIEDKFNVIGGGNKIPYNGSIIPASGIPITP